MATGGFIDYTGKSVLVTGGSSGVGAALVDLLAGLGAEVTVLDRQQPPDSLSGAIASFIQVDLSDPDSVDAAIEQAPAALDVLVNNAGVADTFPPRVVIAVNYLALRRLSEKLIDRMPAGSAIVNTASMAGQGWPAHLTEINELISIGDWEKSLEWVDTHQPTLFPQTYGFSKEINQIWTRRSSHATIARGVRTVSVCPGIIDTPLLTDFRATMGEQVIDWTVSQSTGVLCTPREVANVIAFLGSSAASLINGENVYADYGFSAAMATGQVDFSGMA
jgi:NAD(P)-dependent dehydrogenase (short-subunit alcohol dehydrogenase family)